jgi:hypothetical protein
LRRRPLRSSPTTASSRSILSSAKASKAHGTWPARSPACSLHDPIRRNRFPRRGRTQPAERARQAFQKAEEHADKVAAKLWFLDLKFAHFFTPKLAGALWAIFLCLIAIQFLISFFQSLAMLASHPFMSMGGMLLALVGLVFGVVCSRVVLEVLLVMFRIAERLEDLKHLEHLKHLETGGTLR